MLKVPERGISTDEEASLIHQQQKVLRVHSKFQRGKRNSTEKKPGYRRVLEGEPVAKKKLHLFTQQGLIDYYRRLCSPILKKKKGEVSSNKEVCNCRSTAGSQ